jgi:hypothetical protein
VSSIGQPCEHRSGDLPIDDALCGKPPARRHAFVGGRARESGLIIPQVPINPQIPKIARIPEVRVRWLVVQRVILGKGGGDDQVQDRFLAGVARVDRTQGIRLAVSAQTPETRALVNIVPAAHIARGIFAPR